jgi:hypothetical protein
MIQKLGKSGPLQCQNTELGQDFLLPNAQMQGSHRQSIGRLADGTRLDYGFGAIRKIAEGVDHCALTGIVD